MGRRPPHVLVTTPESLYILLTSDGGRAVLRTVRTVIVGPLGVEFEVDEGDMQVRVLSIWDAEKASHDPTSN